MLLYKKKMLLMTFSTTLVQSYNFACGPVWAYETWSLDIKGEHRLRAFENRLPKRVFGPKREEVMGEWRKLHNENLHDLYSSPSIIRIIKSRRMIGGAFSVNGGEEECV
jgi:hypothetical protein